MSGSHHFVCLVDFHQDHFVVHQVVVDERHYQPQLHHSQHTLHHDHGEVGGGVGVNGNRDDDADHDDGHQQKQDDSQGFAAPVPAHFGREVGAAVLGVLVGEEADLVVAVAATDAGEVDFAAHGDESALDVLEEAVLVVLHVAAAGVDQSPGFLVADAAASCEIFVGVVDDEGGEAVPVFVHVFFGSETGGDFAHTYAKLKVIIIYVV